MANSKATTHNRKPQSVATIARPTRQLITNLLIQPISGLGVREYSLIGKDHVATMKALMTLARLEYILLASEGLTTSKGAAQLRSELRSTIMRAQSDIHIGAGLPGGEPQREWCERRVRRVEMQPLENRYREIISKAAAFCKMVEPGSDRFYAMEIGA